MVQPLDLCPTTWFALPATASSAEPRRQDESAAGRALGRFLLASECVKGCAVHIHGPDGSVRLGLDAGLAAAEVPTAEEMFLATGWEARPAGPVAGGGFPHALRVATPDPTQHLALPDPVFDRTLALLHGLGSRGLRTRLVLRFSWPGCAPALQDDIMQVASRLRRGDPTLRRRIMDLWVESIGLRTTLSVQAERPLPDLVAFRLQETLRIDLRTRIVWASEPTALSTMPSVLHGALSLCGPPASRSTSRRGLTRRS